MRLGFFAFLSRAGLAGALAVGAAALMIASAPACSSAERISPTDAGIHRDGGGDAATGLTVTIHPKQPPLPGESECTVTEVTNIPIEPYMHVPICTEVTYATNPPSGGDHWPVWAAFKTYDVPVRREMFVHNLEHGSVVLAYRCAIPCPDVVAALQSVKDAQGDLLCAMMGTAVTSRTLITPDPKLTTPIAASAWGATYTATCIDKESLAKFVSLAIGHGPEALCADGLDQPSWPDCGG